MKFLEFINKIKNKYTLKHKMVNLSQTPMGAGFPGDYMQDMTITGKWTNRRTGQVVTVRDTMIMDDSMAVMLSDGTMIDMGEFSRDYIQMSDEIYDEHGKMVGKEEFHGSFIPEQHHHEHRPVPPVKPAPAPSYKPQQKPAVPAKPKPQPKPELPKDICPEHLALVSKLFETKKPEISVDLKLKSHNFPVEEIKMLIDVFGVTPKEIAFYMFKRNFTVDMVISAIVDYIKKVAGIKEPEVLDPGFNAEPEKPSCDCKPKHNHSHCPGDDPSSDPIPWFGEDHHKKPHRECDCECKEEPKEEEETDEDIVVEFPEDLDPDFTVDKEPIEEDENTAVLPTGEPVFGTWENKNGQQVFVGFLDNGSEIYITIEEDGSRTYMVNEGDDEWYFWIYDEEGNVTKEKMPVFQG